MKKRNIFFIVLTTLAAAVGIIFLIGVLQKESEIAVEESGADNVERIKNLLNNSFFENELSGNNWRFTATENDSENGFDNLVKMEGEYSYSFANSSGSAESFLLQRITGVTPDIKLSLLGFMRTEDCDSARFEIDLIHGDSLLSRGYSPSVHGTTDWEEYNAWIKTYLSNKFDEDRLRAEVKCVLYGKGRVWFDNVRLYSIPLRETIYELESYID